MSTLAERIEAVERSYEFMLAYAAQGRRDESGGSGAEIRRSLTAAADALDGLGNAASEAVRARTNAAAFDPFVAVVAQDAQKAAAALRLVLATRPITSQLVDNLNASIHLRALLTDLFLVDESLKGEG